MSDNLFEENNSQKAPPAIDPEKDYYAELVGEDKQYKTNKDAGMALVQKEAYIKQLERENAEARQDLQGRLTVEEALTKMQSTNKDSTNTNSSNSGKPSGTQENEGTTGAKSLSEEDISKLVETRLEAERAKEIEVREKQTREKNLATVKSTLEKALGSEYQMKVKQMAETLGVSTQFLTDTGAREPKALFKLLDVNTETQAQKTDLFDTAPVRNRVNNEGPKGDDGIRNEKFYTRMRKEDPKRFWSQSIQSQRHQDAIRLGASFFAE